MSGGDSSSGLRYTTCWMGVCVTSVVQYTHASHPRTLSSHTDPAYLSFPIFLHFWHCDIPLLFPVFPILTRSAVFGPGGGEWSIQNLFISEAIWRHLVPHGQFVTVLNARRCPWGWPVAIALLDTRWEEGGRGRINLTKAVKQIRPTQQSQGRTELAVSTSH